MGVTGMQLVVFRTCDAVHRCAAAGWHDCSIVMYSVVSGKWASDCLTGLEIFLSAFGRVAAL